MGKNDCNNTYVSYDCFIKAKTRDPLATKVRILDTAEQHFADHGYDGVSLRAITEGANANLAAVNYHFGGMESLYRAVILRRTRALNSHRLALLEAACAQAGTPLPTLETIILIMAQPLFDLHRSPDKGGRCFVQILSRGLTEPPGHMTRLLAEEYYPQLRHFGQLIRRHVPQLSPEEFLWRYSFFVGAMHHTLATLHQMTSLTRGICRSNDHEGALARLITLSLAVLHASPTIINA